MNKTTISLTMLALLLISACEIQIPQEPTSEELLCNKICESNNSTLITINQYQSPYKNTVCICQDNDHNPIKTYVI